jgi:hypothetical protein
LIHTPLKNDGADNLLNAYKSDFAALKHAKPDLRRYRR